ncbi:MAG TPA: hypothetical protein VEA35_03390 [Ramlibacter sp.]|nr:hypothetical protein [Ramlibacter sp.]
MAAFVLLPTQAHADEYRLAGGTWDMMAFVDIEKIEVDGNYKIAPLLLIFDPADSEFKYGDVVVRYDCSERTAQVMSESYYGHDDSLQKQFGRQEVNTPPEKSSGWFMLNAICDGTAQPVPYNPGRERLFSFVLNTFEQMNSREQPK